jgi:hypothetical protein
MPRSADAESPERALVIACGALARELKAVLAASTFDHLSLACLPAILHNRPDRIPGAVRDMIQASRQAYRRIFCLYGDCGTGGELDRVLAEEGVARLPGAHCYDLFAGAATFAACMDEEPGTFFLTDYLVRHFDRLVLEGLGLDRHPELRDTYFGAYRRVLYLAQSHDPVLLDSAARAAHRLGLAFDCRPTGLGPFAAGLRRLVG